MNALLVTALILCQVASDDSSSDATSEAVIVAESLNAAFEQWLADVEFRGNYTYIKGMSTSEEAALRGEIEHQQTWGDQVVFACRGLIVKNKNEIRVSGDYGAPPLQKLNDRVTRVAFDEIKTGDLQVVHHPDGVRNRETAKTRGSLMTTPNSGGEISLSDRYAAGPASRSQISPLSLWGGEVRLPCILNVLPHIKVDTQTRKIDDSRLEVKLSYDKSSSRTRTIVWRQDFSPPVVESIHEVFDWPEKHARTVNAGYASDFVQCKGGAVAKRIVEVLWNKAQPGQWMVRKWESEDLSSESRADDLAINVAADTQVAGIKESASRSNEMRIDFSKIKKEDLPKPKVALPASPASAPKAASGNLWLILGNVVVIAALGAYFFMRRKNHDAP